MNDNNEIFSKITEVIGLINKCKVYRNTVPNKVIKAADKVKNAMKECDKLSQDEVVKCLALAMMERNQERKSEMNNNFFNI